MPYTKNASVKDFSHVYVEKDILHHENTQRILSKLPNAKVILIDRYQSLFHRARQDYTLQHNVKSLILARQSGTLLYQGSKVCQNFDERYFMYCTSIMNCPYDCDYCWLKGMYDSGMIVIFVNIEDIFQEVENVLQKHPLYICVSYDTDLLGLNELTGYVEKWCEFTVKHPTLTIEIRSKGGKLPPIPETNSRTVFAITMSPENTIRIAEKGSPHLTSRIHLAKQCIQQNIPLRLCIDPIIIYQGWKEDYQNLLETIDKEINFTNVKDVSVGTFRLSQSYFKKIKKSHPDSVILNYPYTLSDGFYHLPDHIEKDVNTYIKQHLTEYISLEKVFEWRDL